MIYVKYNREKLILKMKGHADFANKGEDIICASASILAYTLAQNVRYMESAGVAKDVHIILEEGNAVIACTPVEESETLLCIYDTITTGFALLQCNYPDYVNFIEK